MPSPCAAPNCIFRRLAVLALLSPALSTLEAQERPDSARRDSASHRLPAVRVKEIARRAAAYHTAASATAMRTNTLLRDTPVSISSVSAALINDQRMQSLADVARFVPGVTMGQGEGHRDQPTIRGNNTTADFFVDGIRDDAQYIRDIYNSERVESIRGSNAVSFGRGGGGGVINRVTKAAGWIPVTEASLEGGPNDHRRATVDLDRAAGPVAGRLNAVYQNSGSFRDHVSIERFGINPAGTLLLGNRATLRATYEHFRDHRTVDRGVPSFAGLPVSTPRSIFIGDPDSSYYDAIVHSASVALLAGSPGSISLRSNTRFGRYDKFYQNVYPGAVNAAGDRVSLAAYNNATLRTSLVNQTDIVLPADFAGMRHTLLLGVEAGRALTDNRRETGYFNGSATSLSVPLSSPTVAAPVSFRQSATDADAHVVLNTAALIVQDQVSITPWLKATVAARLERFDLSFHNNRNGDDIARTDVMLSPRAGIILKPAQQLSFYGSYSVSELPSSGDQYSGLSVTTKTLEPEHFVNREVGAKWDAFDRLSLTAALYQLDRTNTTARDPGNPALTVQTGHQRSVGMELTASGNVTEGWQVTGVYANQSATITSATTAAAAGATVPLVPRIAASLWNRVNFLSAGIGLGIIRQTKSYAGIDNAVTLPAFTRVDAALYSPELQGVRLQLNVENILDARYFGTAHSNNNISPGAPRTFRLTGILQR
jgi:catecholate siderophore receptor